MADMRQPARAGRLLRCPAPGLRHGTCTTHPGTAGQPRRARLGFWSVSFAFLVAMAGTTVPTPLYPLYQQRFGLSPLAITVVFAVYAAGVLATLIWFGSLSDRIGRRTVLLAALATAMVSTVLFITADGLAALFAARLLSGVTAGLFTSTASAALADREPGGDRSRAAVVATTSSIGGLGLGPLAAGLLAQFAPHPLRLPFTAEAALIAIAAIAVAVTTDDNQPGIPAIQHHNRLTVPPGIRAIFVPAAAAALAAFALLGLFTALVPSLLADQLHIHSAALSGSIVALVFAASCLAQLSMRSRPSRQATRTGLVLLAAGVVLVAVSAATRSLMLLATAAAISGLGQGLTVLGSFSAVTKSASPQHRAAVIAAYYTAAYAGVAIPVLGVGLLAAPLSLAGASIAFAAGIATLSIILAVDATRRTSARRYRNPLIAQAAPSDVDHPSRAAVPVHQGCQDLSERPATQRHNNPFCAPPTDRTERILSTERGSRTS